MITPGQIISDVQLPQTVQINVDLARAAGTYDLATVSGGAILIRKVSAYVVASGTLFTSAAIKTNGTNPTTIMSAVEGALANLVAQINVALAGGNTPFMMALGQKLQLILVGVQGVGQITLTVEYLPLVAGARLT